MGRTSRNFLLVLGILLGCNVIAQSVQSTDSLINSLSKLEEQDRGKALVKFVSSQMRVDIEKAHKINQEVEKYASARQDTMLLINAAALAAEYYWRKGDYPEGIKAGQESIRLAESHTRFKPELARGLQTVGTIHLYELNDEKALEYYNKAGAIYKATNQMTSVASIYNNTGVVFLDKAETTQNDIYYDSAARYFNEVLAIREHAKTGTLMNATGNLGTIYVNLEEWDKARNVFDLWESLEAENPDQIAKAMNLGNIGILHLELNELDRSEKYFRDGLEAALETDNIYEEQNYYRHLSLLEERKNNYKVALDYSKKWISLKDSIFNIDKSREIGELETKYEVAKKEQQIQLAEAELERKQRFQQFLIIVISLILVFSIVAFFILRQRYLLKQALLSQEIDNLRLQINNVLGSEKKELELSYEELNKKLNNPISDREFEILQLALTDLNNREIAEKVFVSVNTVKYHLKNIYVKLGVSNRKEALEVVLNTNQ